MTQPKPRPFSSLAIGDKFRLDDSRQWPLGREGTFVKTNLSAVFTNARDSQGNSWAISPNTPVIRIHNHEPA